VCQPRLPWQSTLLVIIMALVTRMGGFNAVLLTAYLVAMVALLTALLLVLAVLVTIVVNNNIGVGMLDHLVGLPWP
jgi:hypothetical protein